MSEIDQRDERHEARMKRKKDVVDQAIAAAQVERGVLVVNTGTGKGKSSAAFGVVARALGHGMKVGVVQFIKGRSDTGEEAFYRRQPKVAGMPSFSTLYTAINTLSGHYASYGNKYPVPTKRKERLTQQYKEIERALARGK